MIMTLQDFLLGCAQPWPPSARVQHSWTNRPPKKPSGDGRLGDAWQEVVVVSPWFGASSWSSLSHPSLAQGTSPPWGRDGISSSENIPPAPWMDPPQPRRNPWKPPRPWCCTRGPCLSSWLPLCCCRHIRLFGLVRGCPCCEDRSLSLSLCRVIPLRSCVTLLFGQCPGRPPRAKTR